jgi:hypothetical protein
MEEKMSEENFLFVRKEDALDSREPAKLIVKEA